MKENKKQSFYGRRIANAGYCLILAVFTLTVQVRSGAYQSDFSLDPDEPAHAVSSLMVHDYLVHPSPLNPVSFAQRFYDHYPKVAIGHWPPLFYICEGLWTVVFGRNRTGLLSFVAGCGALLICSMYCALQLQVPKAFAFFASLLLLLSRPFERMVSSARPDLLLTLTVFWAAVFAGRFMFLHRRIDFVRYLLLMIVACLVHGRGAVLLLVPFVLFPVARRKFCWKWFLAGSMIFFIFFLPPHFRQGYQVSEATIGTGVRALLTYAFASSHVVLVPLLLASLVDAKHRSGGILRASMWALLLSGCLFVLLVPVPWESYRAITMLAPASILIADGLWLVSERLTKAAKNKRSWQISTAVGCGLAWIAWALMQVPRKPDLEYHDLVANGVLRGHTTTLIAGDARNEGALIAEAALADVSLDRTVLRASKSLATMNWSGDAYSEKYQSAKEIANFLRNRDISLVLIQTGIPRRADILKLKAAVSDTGYEQSKSATLEMYRLGAGVPNVTGPKVTNE